ncbi:MAG: hypothetical protein SCH71_07370 [Desulfobulbaceae bacterium]|nr:hypothetical protein [Desulfobulbaceae bacterium]
MNYITFWRIILFLCLLVPFSPDIVFAKKLVALKVLPENVGVFYEKKTQQFTAIAVFDDGSEADYTKKVGWSLTAFPFSTQKMAPHEIATIDRNGLATVKSTWGRVKVNATYPPPKQPAAFSNVAFLAKLLLAPAPPEPVWPKVAPAIYFLLLSDDK